MIDTIIYMFSGYFYFCPEFKNFGSRKNLSAINDQKNFIIYQNPISS